MSKSNESSKRSGGIIVMSLLGVAFVVLKLCGVIDWSWWWVTAPFWGVFAIIMLLVLIAAIIGAVSGIINKVNGR